MKTVKELIGAGLKYIGKVWTLIIFYTWLCLESVRSVSFELLICLLYNYSLNLVHKQNCKQQINKKIIKIRFIVLANFVS